MRRIVKQREPHSLTEHKKQAHADYRNYLQKDDLRRSLVEEQKGICCYCMSRIRPNSDDMKIEHWQCQERYRARQLEYSNLLGACLGGKGRPEREQHCDTRKGRRDLSFNPADREHNVEQLVRFLADGTIKGCNDDIDRQLNAVLNLNMPRLVENRKAVLDSFKDRLASGKKLDPARELPKWDGSQNVELPEYAQVVVYYLRKRLARAV